jgi:hypothetical protein
LSGIFRGRPARNRPRGRPEPKNLDSDADPRSVFTRIKAPSQRIVRPRSRKSGPPVGLRQSDSSSTDAGHAEGLKRRAEEPRLVAASVRVAPVDPGRLQVDAPPRRRRSCADARATEFPRRCRIAGVSGVSLHSYRHSWAQRAKFCGYPQRFAQEALGHTSRAVHEAYARGACVICPPLDEYENLADANIVSLPTALTRRPNVALQS